MRGHPFTVCIRPAPHEDAVSGCTRTFDARNSGRQCPPSQNGTSATPPLGALASQKRLTLNCLPCNMDYMEAEKPISDALRKAIAESGVSFLGLEQATGVLRQSLMKFARGEQCLRGD